MIIQSWCLVNYTQSGKMYWFKIGWLLLNVLFRFMALIIYKVAYHKCILPLSALENCSTITGFITKVNYSQMINLFHKGWGS